MESKFSLTHLFLLFNTVKIKKEPFEPALWLLSRIFLTKAVLIAVATGRVQVFGYQKTNISFNSRFLQSFR